MNRGRAKRPCDPRRSRIERLIEAAQDGDGWAAEQLIEILTPRIAGFVAKKTDDPGLAEDLVQDVMVAVFAALPGYDPRRDFWPWFTTLRRNAVLQELRKARHAVEVLTDPADLPEPDSTDADLAEAQALLQAIDELPGDLGRAVFLHVYADLTFREIGRLTGESPNTWSSRYRLARGRLRRMLGGSC